MGGGGIYRISREFSIYLRIFRIIEKYKNRNYILLIISFIFLRTYFHYRSCFIRIDDFRKILILFRLMMILIF